MKQTYNVKFKVGDQVYHSVRILDAEGNFEIKTDSKPYKVITVFITHTKGCIDITYTISPIGYESCYKSCVAESQLFASLEEAQKPIGDDFERFPTL